MMNGWIRAGAAAAMLVLGACGARDGGQGNAAANTAISGSLEGAAIGGPFTLVDQDGKKRGWSDFAGQYRLVYFGYTYCPDVCPVDLQRIMQGFRLFEKQAPARAAKVQPMFISVDPGRDTPPVLKNYVEAFHPRLIGLTGTPDEITQVAKEFVVVYAKEQQKGASDYLVSHTRTPYLFGPDGKPIALVPVDDPSTPDVNEGSPQAVAQALDHWVK